MGLIVQYLMTEKVITIDVDRSMKNATSRMSKFSISSLLVFNKEGLAGIITGNDIITRIVCTGLAASKVKVSEIMSEPVLVIRHDKTLEEAVLTMLSHKITKLPVIEKIKGMKRMIGILSLPDVARIQPELMHNNRLLTEEQVDLKAGFYAS